MKLSLAILLVASIVDCTSAAPIQSTPTSQASSGGTDGWPKSGEGWEAGNPDCDMTDVDILHYALTLEHIQDAFYRQGLQKYDRIDFVKAGFSDDIYDNLMEISAEETAHVQFLSETLVSLGAAVSAECTYTFPYTDAASFVALANIIEGVGVSAYLGAAPLITKKPILSAAASITTVEARHSAALRAALSTSPFPTALDPPLFPDEAHTIAHVFLASCPASNPAFPIKFFPALAASSPGPVKPGSTVNLTTAPGTEISPIGDVYGAFVTAKGPVWVALTPVYGDAGGFTFVVPEGVAGQSYVLLNRGDAGVSARSIVAGPTYLEISA